MLLTEAAVQPGQRRKNSDNPLVGIINILKEKKKGSVGFFFPKTGENQPCQGKTHLDILWKYEK